MPRNPVTAYLRLFLMLGVAIATVHAAWPPALFGAEAVPAAGTVAKTREHLHAVFAERYSSLRERADYRDLARFLLQQVERVPAGSVEAYVMADDARRLAARAGAVPVAMAAVDVMAGQFDVDGLSLEGEVVAIAVQEVRTQQERRQLLDIMLRMVEDGLHQKRFEGTARLLSLVQRVTSRIRDPKVRAAALQQRDRVEQTLELWRRFCQAQATLQTHPHDPAANTSCGTYLCLVDGNWEQGLDYLEKSGKILLAAAAKHDRREPQTFEEQVYTGDLWYRLAESDPRWGGFRERARYWYERAIPAADPITRLKLDQRLDSGGASNHLQTAVADSAQAVKPEADAPEPKRKRLALPTNSSLRLKLARVIEAHQDIVWDLEFDHAGKRLATASADHRVCLWNVETGERLQELLAHRAAVKAIAFAPDDETLASAGADNTIRVWNLANGEHQVRQAHSVDVNSIAFHPQGLSLGSASDDHRIILWDLRSNRFLPLQDHAGIIYCLAFSPNGKLLASGSEDKSLKIWELASASRPATWRGHAGSIYAVAFSPDSRLVASAGADDSILLRSVASGRTHVLRGHSNFVFGLAFSPNGRWLASAGKDKTVRIWDVASREVTVTLNEHPDEVKAVAFASDGRFLATACKDGKVRIWEIVDEN